jgi:intein/homing endonuclease
MSVDNYANTINICNKELNKRLNKKALWDDDETVSQLFDILYTAYWQQIHKVLVPQENKTAEAEIRSHIRCIISNHLLPLYAKVEKLSKIAKKSPENTKLLNKYMELYDNFYALAAFRSLKHFALYMEFDTDPKDRVWENVMPCFEGLYFYINKMVLDGSIKHICKQYPTGFGKCILETEKAYTPNGYIPLKDLNVGDIVYSLKDNKLVERKITNKWNSRKSQIKITARNGQTIISSPEHHHLTQRGYVRADEITASDYIYEFCAKTDGGQEIDYDELFFISCMLFEGHCKKNLYKFAQQDNEVAAAFEKCLGNLHFDYAKKYHNNCLEYRIKSNNGRVAELLKKYGIFGELATEKRLPQQFFNLSLKQKYEFLGIMFGTDGYICKLRDGGSLTGITLANKPLIGDIQRLLSSCGIYSLVGYKPVHLNGKLFDSWVLQIPDEFIEEIYNNVYCFHKQQVLTDRYNDICAKSMKPYSNCINYPKELFIGKKGFKRRVNKIWNRNSTFKRSFVEEYNNETNELNDIVSKDFVWQKVKSIEAISEEANMVDIEVEETHNFICNGIVTHNSYSDVEAISFIFGINPINNDVMKVVGNPTLVSDVMTGIVNTMSSARYAKVFPYYAQFNGKEEIFSICRISQGNQGILVINGSKRPKSFLCCGKETAIDGGRFKYRFYDDICRSKDKENINEHDKDWARYNDCWKKREYDQYNSFEIAGGTAYSIYDFLSRYKEKFGAKKAVPDTRFKYTYVNENTRFVSVSCPKLDFDTDESTYPAKYSTAEAREERNRDMRTFMAMEQQSPLPPEGTPYYWDNLRLYTDLPAKECNGGTRSDFSWAALDLPRKGNNYAALGIFYRDNKSKDFFFTDCVYEKKPLDGKIADKELLDYICEKMVFHKTTNLVVETNTNSMIVSEIRKRLAALGWSCNIIPQYSYENKEVRIFNTQSAILERIRFPDRKMFPESSNMGQLMRHVVCYAYDGKNDDGIDMISMFAKAFVSNGVKMGAIEVLETRR